MGFKQIRKKIISVSVKDIAAEKNFYTTNLFEDKYAVEKYYGQKVEPMLSRVLSKICSKCGNDLKQEGGAVVLNYKTKEELVLSIVFQLLRGKQYREFCQKIYALDAPDIYEKAKQKFSLDKLPEIVYSKDFFKCASMQAAFDEKEVKKIANILYHRTVIVTKITDNAEFVTSDNPVMFMDEEILNSQPFCNGLLNPQTVVYYPLSPKLLVLMYYPDCTTYLPGYGNIELKLFDRKLLMVDSQTNAKLIDKYNKKQYEQSYNWIFSKSSFVLENLLSRINKQKRKF